jgi:ribose transport system permease protein
MSAITARDVGRWVALPTVRRHRGLIMAMAVFSVLFGGLNLTLAKPFGYFDLASTLNNAETLAIASMGATIAVIVGGLDLSAGAVISLSNCIIVYGVGSASDPMTGLTWMLAGILAGCLAGAINGFFIAYVRLQPIVVTLATMFVVQGLTLLIQHEPGGAVSPVYTTIFTGDAIPGMLPSSLVALVGFLLLWALLRRTRFGVALYAVGSDADAARANGINPSRVKFIANIVAGGSYGIAGVFLTAQTGSADPLIGPSMLLPIFVAVVLGGTHLGGGRGGCLGTLFGSLTLILLVNLLLVMNISAFFSTAAEGLLLILAVLGNSLARGSPLWQNLRALTGRWRRLAAPGGRYARKAPAPLRLAITPAGDRPDNELPASAVRAWILQNRDTLGLVLPSYAALIVVLAVTAVVLGHRVTLDDYVGTLLVLTSFPAVIVLGQGIVILSGGLDLSVPWMITLIGVLMAGLSRGSDQAMLWSVPLVLVVAAIIGAINGIGIAILGISPIVMTLAMNGILQAAALVYCNGSPISLVPPGLHWLIRGKVAGFPPVVWMMIPWVIGATLLLTHTTFGRRLYVIGNSPRVAEFAGVPVTRIVIIVYAISACSAALVGLMLSGFGFQATLEMGDAFLLPSIATAVVGGTLITGGRGHYMGMFGGALLLTALSILLSGILLPAAVRSIIFGAAVLAAVVALREGRNLRSDRLDHQGQGGAARR